MKQLLCLLCVCALCWGCAHSRAATPPPPPPHSGDIHDRGVYRDHDRQRHDYDRQRHDYERQRHDYERQRHDAAHTGKPKPPPVGKTRPVPSPNAPGHGKAPSPYR